MPLKDCEKLNIYFGDEKIYSIDYSDTESLTTFSLSDKDGNVVASGNVDDIVDKIIDIAYEQIGE
jgi:hypothetical protein